MQYYRWQAISRSGEYYCGEYAARNKNEVAAFVREHYGYITLIEEKCNSLEFSVFIKKINDKERAIFYSQLAAMLKSGITLLRALEIIKGQRHDQLAIVISKLIKELVEGKSFTKAVKKQENLLGSISTAVISAGEHGGILTELLEELSKYYEEQTEMVRYLKNISLYPLFLIVASFFTGSLFVIKLLPLFSDVYASMGMPDNHFIMVLLGLKNLMEEYWYCFGGLGIAITYVGYLWREKLGRLIFVFPYFKAKKHLYLEIRFNKVLALLLNSGVPLPMAIVTAGNTLNDTIMEKQAGYFAEAVLRGASLSQAASRAVLLFSPMTVEFITVGSEAGNLPEMLKRAVDIQQSELEAEMKNLKTLLEPIVLILVAAFVSAIIYSVASPMLSLATEIPNF